MPTSKGGRGFSLIEILTVLFLISLFTAVVGIPVMNRAFSPGGGQKMAQLLATLAEYTKGWALAHGQTAIMRLNLEDKEVSFFYLTEKKQLKPIQDDKLKKRKLQDEITLSAIQGSKEIKHSGQLDIPFFPTGFSQETILYLRRDQQRWTIHFRKLYGEARIYDNKRDPESLRENVDDQ